MNIEVSPSFKIHAKKAIYAIIFFCISYFLLILLGIAIAIGLVFLGIELIKAVGGNFITLLVAIGLALSGVSLVVFLFKFIFQKSISNTDEMREISDQQHPRLFQTIKVLAADIGTDMPKKVYISSQVNASVFYDSTFWSMFFPVRKNLMIGYGLVNSSTEEELKGILAHEFGHFSQKSMKVGSYVYNCNRIIYNLVYDNNSFESTIEKFGNGHSVLKLTLMLSIFIMRGFQWVLKKMYDFLNISYLSLSREMEFHADAVATNIVGSKVMIESLSRMDLGDRAYNSTMDFVENKLKEDFKLNNFFSLQRKVLSFFGEINNLMFKDRYPLVSLNDMNQYKKSRLIIKDQWASHPTMEERVEKIKKLNIVKKEEDIKEANQLFDNIFKLEEQLSILIYQDSKDLKNISFEEEFAEYKKYFTSITFNNRYNGYYNYKNPLVSDFNLTIDTSSVSFDRLFSDEILSMMNTYYALENDYNDLTFLSEEKHTIKTFDFDGVKYKKSDASNLVNKLKKEKDDLEADIKKHDVLIYNYFYKLAKLTDCFEHWKNLYDSYIQFDKLYDLGFEKTKVIENELNFLNNELQLDVIHVKLKEIKKNEESFREHLATLKDLPFYQKGIAADLQKNVLLYLNNTELYIKGDEWNAESLNILFNCLNSVPHIHSDLLFLAKKELLNFQIEMDSRNE